SNRRDGRRRVCEDWGRCPEQCGFGPRPPADSSRGWNRPAEKPAASPCVSRPIGYSTQKRELFPALTLGRAARQGRRRKGPKSGARGSVLSSGFSSVLLYALFRPSYPIK